MSKQRRWLLAEIERWTKEGLIDARQAATLTALYPEEAPSPWGLIVFCSLGVVVIGLGIVLLIAYNWAEIPRLGKLAIVLSSIAASHGVGWWLMGCADWRRRVGEAVLLLGTVLYGAGIWLVAQAYHIDEHYPNGFLLWSLGALGLAWAAQSVPQLLAATVLIAIWNGAETFGFERGQAFALGLLLVAIGPLIWRLRSALALATALAAITFVLLTNAGCWGGGGAAFTTAFALAVLLIGLGRSDFLARQFPPAVKIVSFFGLLGFLFCSYLLTFDDIAKGLLRWEFKDDASALLFYGWGIFAAAAAVWIGTLVFTLRRQTSQVPMELWLCPIALVYTQILAMRGYTLDAAFLTGVFNCVFLGFTLMWMVRGCRDGALRQAVLGCVLFAAWTFARYFDLFDSLAARGLAFVLLGGALFAEGFFYRKNKLQNAGKEAR